MFKTFFVSLLFLLSHGETDRDLKLSVKGPVLDQCATPTCWAHAFVSYLNVFATKQFGNVHEFDVGYLLYHDLRSRGLAAYRAKEKHLFVGGTLARALALTREHGLAPVNIWKSKTPVVMAYDEVMRSLESHLQTVETQKRTRANQSLFVRAMDKILLHHFGSAPARRDVSWLNPYKLRHHALKAQTKNWAREESRFEHFVIDRHDQLRPINKFVEEEHPTVLHPEEFLDAQLRADVPMVLEFYTRNGAGDYTYSVKQLAPKGLPIYFMDLEHQATYSSAHSTLIHGMCGESLIVQDSRGTKAHHSGLRQLRPNFWRAHAYRAAELIL